MERLRPAAASPAVGGSRRDSRHWQVAGLVGVLLLTVALRFPLLTTIPVGLHFDEAWSGIDAASVTWTHHPVFFTDSNGMEPLYLYLQTISILLFGHTAFALRVVSAVVGTLTIPALYLLVRRLAGWRAGLFAAAILAVTYWHVHVSRLGYRAIALPPFECLAWWALWNGVQKRDWRWLAAGGAFVGAALYTYSTARAFPLAITLWFVWLAVRRRDWRDLARLVLVGAAALVVFAPLGWYFLQHPAEFINRVGQVVVLSPGVSHSSQPAVLVGIERTLGMFSFHGDPQWKYNLSGKPIFDPLMSVFFYAGIVLCGVRMFGGWGTAPRLRSAAINGGRLPSPGVCNTPLQHGSIGTAVPVNSAGGAPWARNRGPVHSQSAFEHYRAPVNPDAAALLLIWFVVMLVPGFVTTDPPETLHTLATVPVVCTFPALGAIWLWQALVRRWSAWRRAGPPLAVALVLAEAAATAISYFIIWAPNPQTYYWLHGDVADLAGILKQTPANATVYIATQYYRHPTVRFLAPGVASRAIWFEADKSLPVQPGPGPAIYAFANGYQPLAASGSALPAATLAAAPRDSAGGVKYRVYRLPGPTTLPALSTPLHVTLGSDVTLLDAAVAAPTASQPGMARVSLRWRVLRKPARKLSLFVHLLDASGHRWAQSDGQGFFSTDWQPGDVVLTTEDVPLPVGTPAVPLHVSVDFYDVATGALLPLGATTTPATAPDGGLIIGTVTPRPQRAPSLDAIPGQRPAQTIRPGLQLVGAVLPTTPVKAGEAVDVTLYVRKTAPGAPADPTLTLRGAGAVDHEPVPSASLLAPLPNGDVLAIRHLLSVPPRDLATVATIQLQTNGAPITLGTVSLTPLARSFAAPAPQHPLAVTFGTVAELLGYDVATDPASKRLTVTLYWKALQPSNIAYTVFAHLVAPNGTLVAQHDGPPAAGAWPTTFWLPNQTVTDKETLTVTDMNHLGRDTLQVGLYDAGAPGGPRLPATGPAGEAAGTYAVVPVQGPSAVPG